MNLLLIQLIRSHSLYYLPFLISIYFHIIIPQQISIQKIMHLRDKGQNRDKNISTIRKCIFFNETITFNAHFKYFSGIDLQCKQKQKK